MLFLWSCPFVVSQYMCGLITEYCLPLYQYDIRTILYHEWHSINKDHNDPVFTGAMWLAVIWCKFFFAADAIGDVGAYAGKAHSARASLHCLTRHRRRLLNLFCNKSKAIAYLSFETFSERLVSNAVSLSHDRRCCNLSNAHKPTKFATHLKNILSIYIFLKNYETINSTIFFNVQYLIILRTVFATALSGSVANPRWTSSCC